jgi:hydrogenase-4 component H
MRKPKLRELIEAIKSLLSWPYTSKFPKVIPTPPEGFRGRPKYSKEDCVGCGACAEVCPARAIDVEDLHFGGRRGVRKLTQRYDVCVFCGQCEAACITDKGIKLSLEYNLAADKRDGMTDIVEKDLLFCELCGEKIACVDHIKWVAKKVGPLAYANPTVYLTRHKNDLGALVESVKGEKRDVKRSDQVSITCPSCRREILFTEQW